MNRISVAIEAYVLSLYPQSMNPVTPPATGPARLATLDSGLAIPSFWSNHEINAAFAEANRIWIREAQIEFRPVRISSRNDTVPADENAMWIYFLNNLGSRGRVSVGFVHQLPSSEGGWGGGRIALVAQEKVSQGLPGFAGNLLAHELGHVLINDPNHATADNQSSNLMHGARHPRIVNAGILNTRQVDEARQRASSI